jgi:hypothetical protein
MPIRKQQSNNGYEKKNSAYGPVIICNHKQGHHSDRKICEFMTLNENLYNPATPTFLLVFDLAQKSSHSHINLIWNVCDRFLFFIFKSYLTHQDSQNITSLIDSYWHAYCLFCAERVIFSCRHYRHANIHRVSCYKAISLFFSVLRPRAGRFWTTKVAKQTSKCL